MADDGSLKFNTKIDVKGFNQGIKETEKAVSKASDSVEASTKKATESIKTTSAKASASAEQTAQKASESAKKVADTVTPAVEQVGEKAGTAVKNASAKATASAKETSSQVSQEADETATKINEILNDTTRSMKSKASAIAGIYRKQGLSQSEAMSKAWEQIERTSKSGNKKLKTDSTSATQKILKNTEKIKNGCNGIGASIGKIGNRIKALKNTLVATISITAITSAITSLTKQSIESTASIKALNSQLEQTFGDMQLQAEQAMQTVSKNSGIVQSRLQGVGTSIYAFAKTTGMDSATALSMMQEALEVTADSAAYYDRSLEDTAESLKSFLKGNYENDSALGLSCTETTRNTMANKLYGKSFIELSESQKQLALLQMVKEANQLSGAMGQASREADGWENVTGNLKESWKQLLAVVGQPALQFATQAVKKLTSALQNLTTYAQQAVNAMYEVFGWEKSDTFSALSSVSDSADSATESIEETTEANEELKNSLAGFDKLNVLSQSKEDSDSSADTSLTPTTADTITSDITAAEIDTTPLDKFYKKFKSTFNKIKKLVTSGDFAGLGVMIAEKFNNLLEDINWTDIQTKAKEWTSNVTSFLNGAISEIDGELIGSTIGNALMVGLVGLHTFLQEFNWEELGNTLADSVNGVFYSIDWLLVGRTLSEAIIGLLDTIIAFIREVDWGKIGEAIGEFIIGIDWWGLLKDAVDLIWACILGIWDLLVGLMKGLGVTDFWSNLFLDAWYGIQNAWSGVKQFFVDVWNGIKGAFSNVTDWFKNTFKTAWTGVKNVFSTGGKIFEGIKDGISSVFTTVVNGLIDGINTVIAVPFNTINSALDVVRGVEIAGWYPFEGIESVAVPQIPKLATGTVVPANYGEFAAILGDNKREPEIVSPLSTMKQALKEVIEEIGITQGDNGDIVIVLEMDGDVVFKKVVKRNNQYKKRHGGKSALA